MPITRSYLKVFRRHYHDKPVRFTAELDRILLDRFGPGSLWGLYSDRTVWNLACETIERYQTEQGRMELLCRVDELEEHIRNLEEGLSCYMRKAECGARAEEEVDCFD